MTTTTTQEARQDVTTQRQEAVQALLADARRIVGEKGVTREALKALSERLLELATHRALFDAADFRRNQAAAIRRPATGSIPVKTVLRST
jgi:hypothetical protein